MLKEGKIYNMETILRNIYLSSDRYLLLNDNKYFIDKLINNYNQAYKSDYQLLQKAIECGACKIVYQFIQQGAVPSLEDKQKFNMLLQQRVGFNSYEANRIINLLFHMVGWDTVSASSKITFREAISNGLRQYAKFSGRTGRREYLLFELFELLTLLLIPISFTFGAGSLWSTDISVLPFKIALLINILLLVPSMAIDYRRLQDIGKSGMYFLLVFVPIGQILLIIWLLSEGNPGTNQYGPSPV